MPPPPTPPIAPPPPASPLSPAERQIQKVKSHYARRELQERNPLGGAATAAALASVPLRPSQKMMIWANHEVGELKLDAIPADAGANTKGVATKERSIQDEHRAALFQWMNEKLADAQLDMGKVTFGVTTATTIVVPGLLIAREAASVTKDLGEKGVSLVTDVPSVTKGLASDIAKTLGSELPIVSGLMDSLGAVPLAGAIFNVLQAGGLSVFLIMTQWEKVQSQRQLRSSWSVIEQVALEAVIRCDNTDLKEKSAALAKSLVGVAATATGVGSLATLPISAVTFVVKYVLLIKEALDMHEANELIRQRKLDAALVERIPTLGLTLPHLPGVDALPLMGILPIGWTARHPGLVRLKQQARKPDNWLMYLALNRMNVFDNTRAADNQLWHEDFERIARLMVQTNYHLYEQRFQLVDSHGANLYKAPPVTRWQEVKQWVKNKIMGSGDKKEAEQAANQLAEAEQRGDAATEKEALEKQIREQGGDGAALIAERTQHKFHTMGTVITDEQAEPDARGPIAREVLVMPATTGARSPDAEAPGGGALPTGAPPAAPAPGGDAPLPSAGGLASTAPLPPAAAAVAAYILDEEEEIETIYA